MNAHLRLTVRRLDGRYRVTARDHQLEHTHRHAFPTRERAQAFADRVRRALDSGADLNLQHWEYTGP